MINPIDYSVSSCGTPQSFLLIFIIVIILHLNNWCPQCVCSIGWLLLSIGDQNSGLIIIFLFSLCDFVQYWSDCIIKQILRWLIWLGQGCTTATSARTMYAVMMILSLNLFRWTQLQLISQHEPCYGQSFTLTRPFGDWL